MVMAMFSKSIGVKDSNEARVLAILEAHRMFVRAYETKLIVESDSSNVISWVAGSNGVLGRSILFLMRPRQCPRQFKWTLSMCCVLWSMCQPSKGKIAFFLLLFSICNLFCLQFV